MRKKILMSFVLLSFMVFLCPLAKSQRNLVTIPTDCQSITDALQMVDSSGRINVVNGTYYEYPKITNSVSLMSLNSSRFGVTIDGKYKNYYPDPCQIGVYNADNVTVSGFTFHTTFISYIDMGIYAENCKNLLIKNCYFDETCLFGIYLYNVSNAVIYNNYVDAYEMPLMIYKCTNITVIYNTLKDAYEQFQFYHSRNIVFHHNNVFNDEYSTHPTSDYPQVKNTTCQWDDGHGEGNYWSDYAERYPNATNNGLIWSTPYQIEPDDIDGREHFDSYPLVTDPELPTPRRFDFEDFMQYYLRKGLLIMMSEERG